jgi:predicted AAA+ superfamily ATPase
MDRILPHTYRAVLAELRRRLREQAPGRLQILTGPRQVGKTTLLLELQRALGRRAVYAAADSPEASLPGWWELQWRAAEEHAHAGSGYLLLDEIQSLAGWSSLLKGKYDQVRREELPLQVVVTGSSALAVSGGSRESLAGRFELLQLTHWPAAELAAAFGLGIDQAVQQGVRLGGYPGAVALWGDPPRWRAYIRESIIEPAIGRDILLLESVRKPGLLRQLFAACAGHPAEIISLQKLCGKLLEQGALETIAHYLGLLERAYLVAPLQKYSSKALRRRASPPKLVVLDQAILSASGSAIPEPASDPAAWGRWVENACLAHAWNSGQAVSYWREEPFEVDAILEGSWGRWAVEVKTGPCTVRDLAGLTEFCRRHPGFRPLLLGEPGQLETAKRAGIAALSWAEFLTGGVRGLKGVKP